MTEPKKPQTYDHLKSRKKPVQKFVWIALDPDLADEEAELKETLGRARLRQIARPDDATVAKDVEAAEKAHKAIETELRKPENSQKFVVRSVGRKRYDGIIGECKPTPEQVAEVKAADPDADLDFNPETFPQALVAACIVSPELTKSEVMDMWDSDDWNASELAAIFEAALIANNSRRVLDMGNGSRGSSN